ncbi:MAG: hypothetical protein ACYTGP_06480 [Planctomycetota bacterium]|jgi:hypothetical protein
MSEPESTAEEPKPPRSEWIDAAARSVTEIVFDSREEPERVDSPGPDFAVAYEGERGRVNLHMRPAMLPNERIWRVRGQVVAGPDAEVGDVVLREAGTRRDVAVCGSDEIGRFQVDVPAGAYDVLIALDDSTVVLTLPGLVIGALEPS